jgi:chorismate mutase
MTEPTGEWAPTLEKTSPERPETLDSLREQIDVLDRELARVLAERSQLIPKVVDAKLAQNLPIFQPEREARQYEKFDAMAAEFEIDPGYMRKIFELIIEQSKEVQNRILAEKGLPSSNESRSTNTK